jgi:hypothetical protein
VTASLEPDRPAKLVDPRQWHQITEIPRLPNLWLRLCPGSLWPAIDLAIARGEPMFHTDPSLVHMPYPVWIRFCELAERGEFAYLERVMEDAEARQAQAAERDDDNDSPLAIEPPVQGRAESSTEHQ